MRVLTRVLFFVLTQCGVHMYAKTGDIDDLYTSIGARLADVKKQVPACASTMGPVLDDFDRMYNVAKTSQQQDKAAMKELEAKTIENVALQRELTTAKQEAAALKQVAQEDQLKVIALTKELEKERAQVTALKEQLAQLQQKTGQGDVLSSEFSKLTTGAKDDVGGKEAVLASGVAQNLKRTSTSEPSSPR